MRWCSRSVEGTRSAARCLARSVGPEGLVIALVGPLGSGKTAFVQGLAEGLGIDPRQVASPTFVVASQYRGAERWLHHVDLYRVESRGELEATGFSDLLEVGAVVAVEWADRHLGALPADRLELRLERPDPEGAPSIRVLHALPAGPIAAAALARWEAALLALPVDQGALEAQNG